MKIPRNVNGRDFANHLIRRWGFIESRQRGSHIVLHSTEPTFQVSVPAHKPLRLGTFSGLLDLIAERKAVSIPEILAKL